MTFIWKASTAYISKEVEFVRHGVEKASSMLLAELKSSLDRKARNQKYEEMTDFSLSKVTIEIDKTSEHGKKFELLESYLVDRSKQSFFVVRIVCMRLLYVLAATFCSAWLYRLVCKLD